MAPISKRTIINLADLMFREQKDVSLEKYEAMDLLHQAHYQNRPVVVCSGWMGAESPRLGQVYEILDEAMTIDLVPHHLHHDVEVSTKTGRLYAFKIPNWSRP